MQTESIETESIETEPKFIAGVNDELLRVPQITKKVGSIASSTWWAWVKEGKAPKGIKLSHRVTVWRASDIQAFIEKLATNGLEG